jgi:hypothetical protein
VFKSHLTWIHAVDLSKVTWPEVTSPALTVSDRTTSCPEVTEVIACACAYFPRVLFFLTIVVVQNVGTRDRRSGDPEVCSSGSHGSDRVRIPNRYHGYLSPKVTRRGGRVHACATGSWVSRPFFGCFRICYIVLHVRVLTVWYF